MASMPSVSSSAAVTACTSPSAARSRPRCALALRQSLAPAGSWAFNGILSPWCGAVVGGEVGREEGEAAIATIQGHHGSPWRRSSRRAATSSTRFQKPWVASARRSCLVRRTSQGLTGRSNRLISEGIFYPLLLLTRETNRRSSAVITVSGSSTMHTNAAPMTGTPSWISCRSLDDVAPAQRRSSHVGGAVQFGARHEGDKRRPRSVAPAAESAWRLRHTPRRSRQRPRPRRCFTGAMAGGHSRARRSPSAPRRTPPVPWPRPWRPAWPRAGPRCWQFLAIAVSADRQCVALRRGTSTDMMVQFVHPPLMMPSSGIPADPARQNSRANTTASSGLEQESLPGR